MSNVKIAMSQAAAAGVPKDGSWDLSYAYYDDPFKYDITTATYVQTRTIGAQEGNPTGLFFKADGTKMYVTGDVSDRVHEYSLSTAWDVTTASNTTSFLVASNPECLFFSPDGTKMYVAASTSGVVSEYTLSTAWDVSTSSFIQSFDVSGVTVRGLFFSPDGANMYITGLSISAVNQYTLSTAWDISTASFLQQYSLAGTITAEEDLSFSKDGTRMFIPDSSADDVTSFVLSTPWDISTASVESTFSVAVQESTPSGLFMSDVGFMYVVGAQGDDVNQYYLSGGFSVAAKETAPTDVFFKPDGTEMYVIGTGGDDVNQYSLSTAWDTSTATYTRVFDTGTVTTRPFGLYFKPDGTTLYTIGIDTDAVSQWSLSVPWDVSSTSYVQQFSIAAQDTNPRGVSFKSDGTKMYVVGPTGADVNEYDLSTPWDVSTASFLQLFSVAAQDSAPTGIFFKPDGTKMYIVGSTGDDINEYSLSTAWDVSTASFLQLFSVAVQDTVPYGLSFKDDGTQMFLMGGATDRVYVYSLGVQE